MFNEKQLLAEKEHYRFEDLVRIVEILRSPDGCPWDQKQGHADLRNNLIEEAYEVCEGIDRNDTSIMCEELGDVLLQIVFHAGIAADNGEFYLQDVIDGISKKMIRRHPHVFSDSKEIPSWEEIKRAEKKELSTKDSLQSIATTLPALMRAEKFVKKGAKEPIFLPEDEENLTLGRELYKIVKDCCKNGLNPEEILNNYLKKML